MLLKFFITGTDTGVGKTYVSTQLLTSFSHYGYQTLGLKPLATGAVNNKNEDAIALINASSVKLPYHLINPILFTPAIAPHIAAAQSNYHLSVQDLLDKTEFTLHYPADICLVEGVGGWYVPLNEKETMADFVIRANLDVILVVAIRLGCLNHALLTYQAILQKGAKLYGWVANPIEPVNEISIAMINYLQQQIPAPLLHVS